MLSTCSLLHVHACVDVRVHAGQPHIMLFQMYWKHHYGGEEHYLQRAIDILWQMVEISTWVPALRGRPAS